MEASIVYWGNIGIVEKKVEATAPALSALSSSRRPLIPCGRANLPISTGFKILQFFMGLQEKRVPPPKEYTPNPKDPPSCATPSSLLGVSREQGNIVHTHYIKNKF